MASPDSADPHYSLSPLGAGDLIDRAVRFYRNNFWTFVVIASPPVIVGTIISVGWTMLSREMFSVGASRYSGDTPFYYLFLWFGSVVIWMTETIATLAVMGGASRNFVRHLLFGESITFRETYRNTWNRLPGLLVASSLIAMALGIFGIMIFYFGALLAVLLIGLIAFVFSFFPLALVILSIVAGVAAAVGAGWLFFLVASRVAYVPQVMLVEGQGVFAAIGRSVSLASGNVTRLAALFIFSTFAAYSALAILYVPLAWYATAKGVPLMTFDADLIPAWYEIAYNLIWQISFILLSPVWMVGLCLLYVDERVRTEGYDLELMAARRLGDIPSVPDAYVNPLHPALSDQAQAIATTRQDRSGFTTLGLK
jgi:hypothetical protein